MVVFDSECIYVDSKTTISAKITALDNIIGALMTTALKAASTGNLEEYSLDDGQTKIRTMYRSVDQIEKAITSFEKIRQMYINRLDGRMVRLIDGKNFVRNRY